jgi:hypothetical protein
LRNRDRKRGEELLRRIAAFEKTQRPLPGISNAAARRALVEQMVESIRRNEYIAVIRARGCSESRLDPASPIFDPIRAAILNAKSGNLDEAFWLTFLFVHFGKHRRSGYRLVQDVYGGLGGVRWSWPKVSADPFGFRHWLDRNEAGIKIRGGKFGNHRKYQSLSAWKPAGTGAAVESYVKWVVTKGGHERLVSGVEAKYGGDRRRVFHDLYLRMSTVVSFGRTARFDFLTMVGKLGLANIEPPYAYMQGATGPLEGARLLFGHPGLPAGKAEHEVVALEKDLGVGMQVMEDSLCNWQKSPSLFIPFRG